MSYKSAKEILPATLLEQLQHYIEGECLYIPRRHESRKAWGESNQAKLQTQSRNLCIIKDRQRGLSTAELAEKYYLSQKSIQRIIRSST